jgi:hypothetical protein
MSAGGRGNAAALFCMSDPRPRGPHTLFTISASSANDVWAVGSYIDPSTGAWTPYAEHFNGTAWSVVTLPEPASRVGTLTSVVANNPTDVWAVGYTGPNTIAAASTGTLIEHWNGTAWSIVTSPSPGTKAALTGVTTSNAADNVWAVGHYIPAGGASPRRSSSTGTARPGLPSPAQTSASRAACWVPPPARARAPSGRWALATPEPGRAH